MIGFFAIRRLHESRKLSPGLMDGQIGVEFYPSRGEPVHLMNSYKLDELYDLDAGRRQGETIAFVANQIIHSYILLLRVHPKGGLAGVWFVSDRKRSTGLRYVTRTEIARVFELVAHDELNNVNMRYDKCVGDWVSTARTPS